MIATVTSRAAGVVSFAAGAVTGDGTAITLPLGFAPKYIRVVNVTDVEVWEKHAGMTAAQAVKTVTAGTTTIDTGSAIVINSDNTVTLLAAEFGTSDVIHWAAWG